MRASLSSSCLVLVCRELFFHMYTSSGVLLLLEVGTKQNKRSSILNQRELKKTHGKHHACQAAATCYAFRTCGEHQCMQMLLPPPDVKMTRQGQFN